MRGIRIDPHVVVGERSARKLHPRLDRKVHLLVRRMLRDVDDEPLDVELLLHRERDGDVPDVRRVEGASEERDP